MSERRDWIRKLQDEFYSSPKWIGCPVCRVNAEEMVERHQREVDRLKGALLLIAGQENTIFGSGDDRGVSLDAEGKMRQLAREALKAYPDVQLANKEHSGG